MTTTITGATGIDNIQAATGSVLQVVTATSTATFSTTSTSFVDVTGFTATLTPTSASSKILVFVSFRYGVGSAQGTSSRLLRNATVISLGAYANLGNPWTGNGSVAQGSSDSSFSYLDSPATTSALTYKLQVTTDGGTMNVNNRNGASSPSIHIGSITVMEIAG